MLDVGELQSWDPSLPDDVVHLLGDGGVIERGQEGEGLEEPADDRVVDQRPSLSTLYKCGFKDIQDHLARLHVIKQYCCFLQGGRQLDWRDNELKGARTREGLGQEEQAKGAALVVHGLPHEHLAGACTVADGPLGEGGHGLAGQAAAAEPVEGLGSDGRCGAGHHGGSEGGHCSKIWGGGV